VSHIESAGNWFIPPDATARPVTGVRTGRKSNAIVAATTDAYSVPSVLLPILSQARISVSSIKSISRTAHATILYVRNESKRPCPSAARLRPSRPYHEGNNAKILWLPSGCVLLQCLHPMCRADASKGKHDLGFAAHLDGPQPNRPAFPDDEDAGISEEETPGLQDEYTHSLNTVNAEIPSSPPLSSDEGELVAADTDSDSDTETAWQAAASLSLDEASDSALTEYCIGRACALLFPRDAYPDYKDPFYGICLDSKCGVCHVVTSECACLSPAKIILVLGSLDATPDNTAARVRTTFELPVSSEGDAQVWTFRKVLRMVEPLLTRLEDLPGAAPDLLARYYRQPEKRDLVCATRRDEKRRKILASLAGPARLACTSADKTKRPVAPEVTPVVPTALSRWLVRRPSSPSAEPDGACAEIAVADSSSAVAGSSQKQTLLRRPTVS
jgi:hypothetical protein